MGEAVPCLRQGDSPGRAGSWDTATGFSTAATCDRLSGNRNAQGGGEGVGGSVKSPSRSQQLTQPPNPHRLNSIPIQLMFLECLLCATARELLDAADFQVFGFKKNTSFSHSVGLGLKILTPSQVGISFPSDFWKASSLPSSLSQRVAHTQQFQPSREHFSFSPFRKSSSSGLVIRILHLKSPWE